MTILHKSIGSKLLGAKVFSSPAEVFDSSPIIELISNGTFDTNVDDWLARNSVLIEHQPSGVARATIDGFAWGGIYQLLTVEDGKTYRVQAEAVAASGASARVLMGPTLGAASFYNNGPISVPQSFDATFSVTGTIMYALFLTNSSGDGNWVEWDNISIYKT